jgi:hypothetical protein
MAGAGRIARAFGNADLAASLAGVRGQATDIEKLIERLRQESAPARRFSTERGSLYVALPDGTTVRHKAARPEHGGDYGWKQRSEQTVYLSPQAANNLSLVHATGPRPYRLVQDTDSPRMAVAYVGHDRPIPGTVAPFFPDPSVGAMPLEMWGNKNHFGNKIVKLEDEPNWIDWLLRSSGRGQPPSF